MEKSAAIALQPEESFFVAITACANTLGKLGEKALRPLTMTLSEYVLLRAIQRTPGETAAVLRRRLQMSAPALTQTISVLERKAWLKRGNDSQDARRQPLNLTPSGKKRTEQARQNLEQIIDHLKQPRSVIAQITVNLVPIQSAAEQLVSQLAS